MGFFKVSGIGPGTLRWGNLSAGVRSRNCPAARMQSQLELDERSWVVSVTFMQFAGSLHIADSLIANRALNNPLHTSTLWPGTLTGTTGQCI